MSGQAEAQQGESPKGAEKSKGMWSSVPQKVRLLILAGAVNGLAFGYFLIYITSYFPQSTGNGSDVIGIILGFEATVVLIAGIPMAMLSDKKGRKWFLIAGNALFVPTIFIFAFTKDVNLILVAAGIGGLAETMGLSSWNALIADFTDHTNRDAAFALSFVVGTASFSVGSALPLAFPVLQSMTGLTAAEIHSYAFIVMGFVSISAPVMFWLQLKGHKETFLEKKSEGLKLGGLGQTIKFSLCNSTIAFGAGLIIPLVALWLLYKYDVPDTFSGPYLALSGLSIAFAAVGSPRISKRLGLFPAILATAGSSTIFMFSLAFIGNVYIAGAVYLVRAGLMNMNAPLMDSFLMGITKPERRGLASTLNALIWRLPNTGSTILGGYILKSAAYGVPALRLTNLDVPWALAAIFYIVGITLLYVNFRHVKPPTP